MILNAKKVFLDNLDLTKLQFLNSEQCYCIISYYLFFFLNLLTVENINMFYNITIPYIVYQQKMFSYKFNHVLI